MIMNTLKRVICSMPLLVAACGDGDDFPELPARDSGIMDAGPWDAGPLDARVDRETSVEND
jgi:hypothetical protein